MVRITCWRKTHSEGETSKFHTESGTRSRNQAQNLLAIRRERSKPTRKSWFGHITRFWLNIREIFTAKKPKLRPRLLGPLLLIERFIRWSSVIYIPDWNIFLIWMLSLFRNTVQSPHNCEKQNSGSVHPDPGARQRSQATKWQWNNRLPPQRLGLFFICSI